MKLLTVTVPCFNSQDYMEKCINSLLVDSDDQLSADFPEFLKRLEDCQ